MKWTDRLTNHERDHLKANKVKSRIGMRKMRKDQKVMQSYRFDKSEVCPDCRTIAVKLGLEK